MYLIGLTGGIAAGKTTVARRLAAQGAHHLNADGLAREVVAPGTPGLLAVRQWFGERFVQSDGSLDRLALAAVVFEDPGALAELNAIIHPLVRDLARERFARISDQEADPVVVYDVPLLVEAGVDYDWDLVVTVEAPPGIRLERLQRIRGLSREDAQARLDRQASEEQRRAVADIVIDASGDEGYTLEQADALWDRVCSERQKK